MTIGGMSQRRNQVRLWCWLSLGLLVLAVGLIWHQGRTRSWRTELSLAREATKAGRFGLARERLSRLAERWSNDGEVFLLLGECELQRGRREEALASWAKVPVPSPYFAQAARLRASSLIQLGRYAPAEAILDQALSNPGANGPADLESELTQLYQSEGRFDDMRRVLRGSWSRSSDLAGGLRAIWMVDHAAIPVEIWKFALDHADNGDDRVWLGRARHAILTGGFPEAARWLAACLGRRPEDPAVWRARLDLARATDDPAGFWAAADRLPAHRFETREIQELRVWLAARRGETAVEQRELETLIRVDPGNTQALDRLAALATRAGRFGEAEPLRDRKAAVDRTLHRYHQILLDGHFDSSRAAVLAGLAAGLGRGFEAQGWAILAEAGTSVVDPAGGGASRSASPAPLTPSLMAKAVALSAPFPVFTPGGGHGRPTLSDRLADLRTAEPSGRDTPSRSPMEDLGVGIEPPGAVPEFVDAAADAGLGFAFDNGQTPQRFLAETLSGGVGLLDFDGDGWLDVYAVQGGTSMPGMVTRGTTPRTRATACFATEVTARSRT